MDDAYLDTTRRPVRKARKRFFIVALSSVLAVVALGCVAVEPPTPPAPLQFDLTDRRTLTQIGSVGAPLLREVDFTASMIRIYGRVSPTQCQRIRAAMNALEWKSENSPEARTAVRHLHAGLVESGCTE